MSADNLPHSPEAEEAVLGSILIDAGAYPRIAGILCEDDFFRPDHRLIYGAVTSLARSAVTPDAVTIGDELKRQGKDADAGGLAYLGQLARNTPTAANVATYAQVVRERAFARRALEIGDRISQALIKRERGTPDVLAEAERQFGRLKDQFSGAAEARRKLQSIEIREFLTRDIPPRGHVLAPVIPEQGLVMAYGPRGLGKTHLSVGIAVAVSAGGKFLRWSAPKPAGVLLVDGEMPAAAIQARFADAIKASEFEPQAPLHLVTPDLNWDCGMPDLSTSEGQNAVDTLVTEDTRLIIVDNLSSLMRSGVENDAESWLPLQTWALRHRAAGRSVLFIHHAGKGGSQRGTSRREDVLDVVIAIRRPSDYRHDEGARFELHIEKGRSLFGKEAAPFEAALTADAHGAPLWTVRDVEIHQQEQILELHGLGMKPADIAAELGIGRATVYRKLKGNGIGAGKEAGHA
jgi:hypothetical protein